MQWRTALIRGPTHVTQTDVWVSRGDTLSLFKRRGNPCSGNRAGGNSSKIACPSVVAALLRNSAPTSSVTSRVSHRRESAPAGTGPCTMFLTRCVRAADALPSTMLCSYSCGGHPRPNWCKSKDAPQTERNAIDAQNEGAHRADLLSASHAWRKVVRAT